MGIDTKQDADWTTIYIDYFSGELDRATSELEEEFCRRNLTLACCALSMELGEPVLEAGFNKFNQVLPESIRPNTNQEWRYMAKKAAANVAGNYPTGTAKEIFDGLGLGKLYYRDLGRVTLSANQ